MPASPVRYSTALFVGAVAAMLAVAEAQAQCSLTGNPDVVDTLAHREVVSGKTEVIQQPPSASGLPVTPGLRPREFAANTQWEKRFATGTETFRYTNKSVPGSQTHEMHIVGAGTPPLQSVVGPAKKPVVLVLVSNGEIADWNLFVAPGTTLAKVVLQGIASPARVEGVPGGIEVVRRLPCEFHTTGRGGQRLASGRQAGEHQSSELEISPSRLRRVIADIRAFTGLVETTFQHGLAPSELIVSAERASVLPALEPLGREAAAKATDDKLIAYMEAVRARVPEAVRPVVSLLVDLVRQRRLPAATYDESGERLPLLWGSPRTAEVGSRLGCTSNVLVGRGPVRSATCSGEGRMYVMEGAGRSTIRESAGDSLIAPGRGSSFIKAGSGRDLIVLERGWGIARIDKICGRALPRLRGRRPPMGLIHTGIIVFGAGIRPENLAWLPRMRHGPFRASSVKSRSPRVLIDRTSKDVLILGQSCFNFVFTEEGRLPSAPWPR